MEKREPSLVPEWLRSSGHGSGVGSSNHLLPSSKSHPGMLSLLDFVIIVSCSLLASILILIPLCGLSD